MLEDGLFFEKYRDRLRCNLCPHKCIISNGKTGICCVRTNRDGVLKSLNYGELTAISMDPIEKKPLYNFKPGTNILSVGTFGCNFSCIFCQNYSIAHYKANSQYLSPEQLIEKSLGLEDNIGLAFTYNEPTIWYEYIYDTGKKLKEIDPGASIVLISNGYINEEPLLRLLPYIDGMNIDLKSFNPAYYEKICGGSLEPVLASIKRASESCHVEVTSLLVNGLNDSEEEVEKIASFLSNINRNIPLHLSRYFPNYKLERPPTEIDVMLRSRDIAREYLNYVYLGNMQGVDNSSYCPNCKGLLLERSIFTTQIHMDSNLCPYCQATTGIIL